MFRTRLSYSMSFDVLWTANGTNRILRDLANRLAKIFRTVDYKDGVKINALHLQGTQPLRRLRSLHKLADWKSIIR